jgi:hypothetical protein
VLRDELQGEAATRDLLDEDDAGDGEENIGAPDADGDGDFVLACEGNADGGEEVVDEDEAEGGDEA